MATRFYLASTGTPPRSPTFNAGWTATTGAVRRKLHTSKESTTNTNLTVTKATATNPANILTAQFVSPPLQAQTISGTVKGIMQCLESAASNDANAQLAIYVFSNDGLTLRGTLLALGAGVSVVSEFNTSIQNREFPLSTNYPATLSSVTCQDEDVIVVEIGARYFVATTSISHSIRFGEVGTDLPEDETTTADGAPWIEFSANLSFVNQTARAPRTGASENGYKGGSATPVITPVSSIGLQASGSGLSYSHPNMPNKLTDQGSTHVFGSAQFGPQAFSSPTPPTKVTVYKLQAWDNTCVPPRSVQWVSSTLSLAGAPSAPCSGPLTNLQVLDQWQA